MRVCSVCGDEKPLSDFHKNGKDKFGNAAYRPECKKCYTTIRNINRKKLNKFFNNTKHRTGEIVDITYDDWKETMLYFKDACAYCGTGRTRSNKLTKDHVVPVVKGGRTIKNNVIPSCSSCNCSKSDSDLEVWYRKQPFFRQDRLSIIQKWRGMV